MPSEEVRRFLAAVETDSGLRAKLEGALKSATDHLSALGTFARAEGFSVEDAELKDALVDSGRELGDEELAKVAGGAGLPQLPLQGDRLFAALKIVQY